MTRIIFDDWVNDYSYRMQSMRRSAVRDLFAAASRSDIISLSGGMPDINKLPLDLVSKTASDAISKEGFASLQYASTDGRIETKKTICKLMEDFDIKVKPDDVIITAGAQQALDLIGKTFLNPGDTIITEAPTYLGALQAFSAYEPNIIGIPLDDDGMRMDVLEEQLEQNKGSKPKFIYTIPTFQNPGGVTMSLNRRMDLIELADKYGVLIIEDDPYSRLRFSGKDIKPLRKIDDRVIYVGTVSKVFAPGLRTGWIIAPDPILKKINLTKQGTDLCGSTINQVLVEHYFNDTNWRDVLSSMTLAYSKRRDAMILALEKYFPEEASFTYPDGGFFIWVTLPDYINTSQMLASALEKGVTYVSGDGCFPNGESVSCMRLAFCYEEEENIEEAIRRLAQVIEDRIELYRAFIQAGVLKI